MSVLNCSVKKGSTNSYSKQLPLQAKPLNRALSFMGLESTLEDDDDDGKNLKTPVIDKPHLADKIGLQMQEPSRVVPQQTVT